jgi:ADP-ribose pyrophosphatase YjhB (NUDIX family)
MSKNNICNNCGKQGHHFHQCKLPITSYGIILFRTTPNYKKQYLMIRRKNSFGYIDFIRGKYIQNNFEHLQVMFNEMSIQEKEDIRTHNFETLWQMMWGIQDSGHQVQFRSEEQSSQKKFEALKNGIPIGDNDAIITLNDIINNSTTKWIDAEWEFPKGRRNYQEKDLDCALREFEEETGISKKNITIIENILPFEEMFIGSNHKSYKHKYFLGYTETTSDLDNYQPTEVSKLEWKTLDECLESIRPYNLEKKQLIINVNTVLNLFYISKPNTELLNK